MSCSSHAPQYQLFVGVDIAAATATVAWQSLKQKPSKPITLEQTPEGFCSLHQRLTRTGALPDQILVVMEATGIYWVSLAPFLARQGYAISVVNPAQAHHFAKALLKRAKTDAIDAQTLTQLAALLQPALWTPPQAIYEELEQRLYRLHQTICGRSNDTKSYLSLSLLPGISHLHERDQVHFCRLIVFIASCFLLFHTIFPFAVRHPRFLCVA